TLVNVLISFIYQACNDYLDLATNQGRRWQKILQYEHDQRLRLEEMLEQLAKQHSNFEKQARKTLAHAVNHNTKISEPNAGVVFVYRCSQYFKGDSQSTDLDRMRNQDRGSSGVLSLTSRWGHIPKKTRRKSIPEKPNYSINLWSIMKNCIGKELSKIPMPVNFSEPLSFLQRLTEDFEYSDVLDNAAVCQDSCEQLAYVAAFATSAFANTTTRTGKPFNPLLGETFECDRRDDLGWRSFAEQVSHHPPMVAMYTEGQTWNSWQEFTMSSIAHLLFLSSGNHYTWRKVTTTVHNIIVGKLWVDNHGEMDIVNHQTGDRCHLKYSAYSYFARETPRKLAIELNELEEGVSLTDSRLRPDQRLMEEGRWDEANKVKILLEEKQRAARRKREQEAAQAISEATSTGLEGSSSFGMAGKYGCGAI
ncbi:hypothetical protein LSH36_3g14027, partial [Paralvinella palmiformis]